MMKKGERKSGNNFRILQNLSGRQSYINLPRLCGIMPVRRKQRTFDASKNRKLNEFLSELEIDGRKKEQILEFVEQLTFETVKEASRRSREKKRVMTLNN